MSVTAMRSAPPVGHAAARSDRSALPARVDVAIIGAGIVGVSTALFLAERGLRVLVCEKGMAGCEQSSRNWGFVRKMGRDPAELPLAIESLAIWRRLDAWLGIETGFRETGIVFAGRSAKDGKNYERWRSIGRDHGVEGQLLGASEIAGLVPALRSGFDIALHTPDDGRAEPVLAVPAIAAALRARGVVIAEGCAVEGVERRGGRVCGIVTQAGAVACEAVVVAAGAWSRRVLAPLGVDFPQLPVIGSVARVEGTGTLPPMPMAADGVAWRPRLDGAVSLALRNSTVSPVTSEAIRLLPDFLPGYLKAWRELRLRPASACPAPLRTRPGRAPSPNETLDPAPDRATLVCALRGLERAVPGASNARITHCWGGVIDATPDGLPVVDGVEGVPGLYLASGFSGHGFGVGPGAGALMANLVMGDAPLVDPAPFRLARFAHARGRSLRMAANDRGRQPTSAG